MARIRSVKPELFRHEGLFEAERDYQLPIRFAFIRLFTCCDREGRFKWRPQHLKLDIFPYDDINISLILEALVERGFIHQYEHEGQWYGCIPSWLKHQHIDHREMQSRIPDPVHCLTEGIKAHALNTPCPKSSLAVHREEKKSVQSLGQAVLVASHGALKTCIETMECEKHPCLEKDELLATQPTTVSGCAPSITAKPSSTDTQHAIADEIGDALAEAGGFEPVLVTPRHAEKCPVMPGGNMEYGRGIGNREYGTRNREGNNTFVAPKSRRSFEDTATQEIFDYWKAKMNHPQAKLDPKRKALIGKALGFGYDIEQLCQAISGCSITPHNRGDNERGQRYDGLHIILRDSDQIDRFIYNYQNPPRPLTEAMRKTKANVESLQQWVNQKMKEDAIHANA